MTDREQEQKTPQEAHPDKFTWGPDDVVIVE